MLLKDNVVSAGKDEICQAATRNDLLFLPSLSKADASLSHEYFFPPPQTEQPGHHATVTLCSLVLLHRSQDRLTCDSVFAVGPGVVSGQSDLISSTLRTFLLLPLLSLCLAPLAFIFFFFFLNTGRGRDPERKAPAFKELRDHVEERSPRKVCREKV